MITVTENGSLDEKQYPTSLDSDGFFYASAEEEANQIYTKVYENGNTIKQTVLPGNKRVAIVRELKGAESKEIARYMGGDKERYIAAGITVATTIDGQKQPIEEYEGMKMKDYNRLMAMFSELNF